MAYIDELLGRDEQVLYIGRQHMLTLLGNVFTELILIVILIITGVAASRYLTKQIVLGQPGGQLVLFVCLLISSIVLLSALIDYLRWTNRQFVVTDRRVIQIEGVLNKEVVDSSLEKINDLELHQSWIGRMLDYGDLEILTGSETAINDMRKIAHPLDFKRALLEAKHNLSRGFGYLDPSVEAYTRPPPGAPRAGSDIDQTLRTLADLRDKGILSNEEFEAKKRELLSRI